MADTMKPVNDHAGAEFELNGGLDTSKPFWERYENKGKCDYPPYCAWEQKGNCHWSNSCKDRKVSNV